MNDLRYAIRLLRSSPAFSLSALVVLSLGIGANGAMFALIDAVLLEPLPVAEPDRLVVLTYVEAGSPDAGYSFSYPAYVDLRDGVTAFSGMLAVSGVRLSVSQGRQSERVRGQIVTADFFQTLGVRPFLGRLLTPGDDTVPGAHPVAVLDYGYWHRLGGERGLVGRDLLVNGHQVTVIGVAPREFYGTELGARPELYVPMALAPVLRPNPSDPLNTRRTHQWLTLMARLKPGVSLEQAKAAAAVVFQQSMTALLAEMSPEASELGRRRVLDSRINLRPGAQGTGRMRRNAERPILLLSGATSLLLLIACANLGNLLLARGTGRQRELALRVALGGSRVRLLRQLLVESLVLTVAGGGAGLLVTFWIVGIILGFLPPGNALGADLAPEPRVIAATFGLSLVAGLLFGLLPAWRVTRQDPATALKADVPSVVVAEGLFSLRSALIVVQVAMSLVLLVGAGLFLRTLANLRGVDTGFAREHVLVATVDPSLNGYDRARSGYALSDFVHRVAGLPGIKRAGLASVSPITNSWDASGISVPGYQPKAGEETAASYAVVSPGYLEAMGIPLREGRMFTWRDGDGAPLVAIVNETMARRYFGNGSAIGRHFSFRGMDRPIEVIGVVRDGKYMDLREETPRFVYVPFLQAPSTGEMMLHARTDGDPLRYVDAIRQQLRAIDPILPLSNITTLEQQIDESLASERILATLGSAFGALALLLAAVGVYGVLAFSVARRTREIGVRMALGASPADVARLVLTQVARVLVIGLAAGTFGAWGAQRAARSLLFEVSPGDPSVLLAAVLLITLTAGLAALFPAWRAARLNPLSALRHD